MADETKPEEEAEEKPSSSPKVMIIGFIALVVVVESALFLFMMPSADDVARLAEEKLIEKVEGEMKEDGDETMEEEDSKKVKELTMGPFEMEFKPPGADRKHRVGFELFGEVAAENFDEAQMLFAEREGRLRDRMLEEVRNASMDELNDMGLIRRRIFATSNELIVADDKKETPLLINVGFRRYSVTEQ